MKIKLTEEASKIMEQGSMLDTVVGGIKDVGRTVYDVAKNRHQYGKEMLGTTEKSLQSQATDVVKNVGKTVYNAARANTTSQQNNMIALCSDLGVKSPGYCDTRGKKPIKSCAEMGIKTPGYCYVDTKQLVPGIKQSTNTIKEQGTTPKVDDNSMLSEQLSRIKTVMGLTNGNINENKRLDEDFVDNVTSAVKSGFNTVKGGIQNVVGGVQKGMNTVASGMVNTLTSDADLKKFNNRILAIANVIKYAKKGTDPKTQQPAWTIINPLSKANGMRLDEYFKTYRVSVGEVEAAKLVNQQGGKPLNATQRVNTSSGQYYRSYAAHPPTFAKLFK
jgi:hypothetical protein